MLAWFACSDWLDVGYQVWRRVFDFPRDYLIPPILRIEDSAVFFRKTPPRYQDFAKATTMTLLHLTLPVWGRRNLLIWDAI